MTGPRCARCGRRADLQITSTKRHVPEPRGDFVCDSHRLDQLHDLTYLGYTLAKEQRSA